MSLQATPARSSRITKRRTTSAAAALGLRRSGSSMSVASPRRKSAQSHKPSENGEEERLFDTGAVASLAADLNFRDVPQFMEYIRNRMFSDMPQTNAGMNSTMIAETLNFRRSLPPIVTIAHVEALSASSTHIEREIVELSQACILRRITIPHRGVGSAAVGDGIVSIREWENRLRSEAQVDSALQEKYMYLMRAHPTSAGVSGKLFTSDEVSTLSGAGFLTNSTAAISQSSLFAAPSIGTLSSLATAGSRHAAGSMEAVGGASALQHLSSGMPGQRVLSSSTYNFSLPNTGAHIKLLIEARAHLIGLLKRFKFREAPLSTLQERWDGGIIGQSDIAAKKQARQEFAGIVAGRTKKWKQFHGLRFEWILEECVGAGLVELFETGSVGQAVRLTRA